LQRTVLFAADLVEGKVLYEYVHQHNPLEEYEQVLTWMTEVHRAVLETYPPPRYAAVMARASSIQKLTEYYPGFRKLVGIQLGDTEGTRAS
jgi:hypothetical protein